MKRLYILLAFIFLLFQDIFPQQLISLNEALDKALKNNFNIQVARNDYQTQKINNTAGNAGMLPTLSAVGSGNYEVNDVNQELASGEKNHYPASSTTALNAGDELSWTMFDGGRMFIAKTQLNELQAQGEIRYREQVQQLMFNVVQAYYTVVKQKEQLKAIETVEQYNLDRLKITKTAFDNGSQPKTNWIQARIDLNVTQESILTQKSVITKAKKELNLLLGQTPDENIEVTDSIEVTFEPEKEALLSKMDTANTSLLFLKKQSEITALNLKSNTRLYAPKLSFKAGYYWSDVTNSDGNVLGNRSIGPQFGGSLIIPLYQAGETRRKTALSKIAMESFEYDMQQTRLEVNTDLQNALDDFNMAKQLMQMEQENYQLSRENLEICMQRLKLGQTNSLEVHQAEESFSQSANRLIQFEFNLKMSETRLKQLVAEL
jgi:outer membrane protein